MNQIKILEKIEVHISKGRYKEALEVSLTMNLSKSTRSDLIQLSGRFHELQNEKIQGILDLQGEKLIKNQIIGSFLAVISEIKQDSTKDNERLAEVSYKIGNNIFQAHNFQIAIEYFSKVIDTEGISNELRLKALNDRGISNLSKGDLEKAKNDFDYILRLQPDNAIALFNRGITLLKLADKDFINSTLLGYETAREYCNILIHSK